MFGIESGMLLTATGSNAGHGEVVPNVVEVEVAVPA
jgi:hypothetical protein